MPNEHLATPSVPNELPRTSPDFAYFRQVDSLTGAGTTQSDAAVIVSGSGSMLLISGAANSGVVLPPIVNIGQEIVIRNNGANTVKVYPAVGSTINALSANASLDYATAKGSILTAITATQWASTPVVPS